MNGLDQKLLAIEIAQAELEAQGYDPKKARKAIQIWHQSETALAEWILKNELTPYTWSDTDFWYHTNAFFESGYTEGDRHLSAIHLWRAWAPLMSRSKIPIRHFIETSMLMGIIPKIPPHKVTRHR